MKRNYPQLKRSKITSDDSVMRDTISAGNRGTPGLWNEITGEINPTRSMVNQPKTRDRIDNPAPKLSDNPSYKNWISSKDGVITEHLTEPEAEAAGGDYFEPNYFRTIEPWANTSGGYNTWKTNQGKNINGQSGYSKPSELPPIPNDKVQYANSGLSQQSELPSIPNDRVKNGQTSNQQQSGDSLTNIFSAMQKLQSALGRPMTKEELQDIFFKLQNLF